MRAFCPQAAALIAVLSAAGSNSTWAQTVGDETSQARKISATEAALKDPEIPVDYYDGLRAWDNGYDAIAISLWLRASEYGDHRSMLRLADAYEQGEVLPRNLTLAAYYRALARSVGAEIPIETIDSVEPEVATAIAERVAAFEPKSLSGLQVGQPTTEPSDLLVEGIYAGDRSKIAKALKSGAQFLKRDKQGWMPIFHAVASKRPEIVLLLLEDSPIAAEIPNGAYSLLHLAAMQGTTEVIDVLLANGAYAIAESSTGMTPADTARMAGFAETARHLENAAREQAVALQEHLNAVGYDVGKPDGELGPRSRAQIAIASSSFGPPQGRISSGLVDQLMSLPANTRWGAIIGFTKEGESGWEQMLTKFEAIGGVAAAEAEALKICSDDSSHSKCKVLAVLPRGSCMALGRTETVYEWSAVYPSITEAKEDALKRCKAARGTDCKIVISACAGM